MEDTKITEQKALDLITEQIEAQKHKLVFVRSSLFFGAWVLLTIAVIVEFIVRQKTGIDAAGGITSLGTIVVVAGLGFYGHRHKTITLNDRSVLNIWLFSIVICLCTSIWVNTNDLRLPAMGFLTMGAAIATAVMSELFRRNSPEEMKKNKSLYNWQNWSGIFGAILSVDIFRTSADDRVIFGFCITLAASTVLLFGTGLVLRAKERRDRV